MGKSGEARWAAVIRSRTKSQSSQEALTTAEAALTAPLGILQSRLEERYVSGFGITLSKQQAV